MHRAIGYHSILLHRNQPQKDRIMLRWPHRFSAFVIGTLLILAACSEAPAKAKHEPRPNILLIAVDDLRPELGCYGVSHIQSPNIDALAASGLRFDRAYCQQAVCNPSRTSLMTGLRPDTIGVTGNHSHFRSNMPDVVTLPQKFMQHGYHAAAIGKLYHGVFPEGTSNTKWDTMGDPQSWSVPAIRFGPRYYYTEAGIDSAKKVFQQIYKPTNPSPNDWTQKLVFGPATEAPDVPDNVLYDGQVADAAVEKLKQLRQQNDPFFLAVGFIKPHSPYVAPKKYFDLYRNVAIASDTKLPVDAPTFAGHGSGELRRYTDQPKRDQISAANQKQIRKAYFACVSYIDAQIGRVLDQLDQSGLSNNTIVVLYGDHGYHLGEHGLWGKTTNFELDTRVPLIIRSPGMKASGKSTSSLVELVDLYPTLTELAGLPPIDKPESPSNKTAASKLEGKSFADILDDHNHVTKTEAFSQYPRGGGLMGYSMRTRTHRLTQWVQRDTGAIKATELYDYAEGLVEKTNLAESSPQMVKRLSIRLAAYTPKVQAEDSKQKNSVANRTTSFEQETPGAFEKLHTSIGVWTPTSGRTIVDGKHAKTGKQCLQLAGGKANCVTLDLTKDANSSGQLTFWAERWTSRTPFSFRIEKNSGDGWNEIFNGDKQVKVGRAFLSNVTVPLGDNTIKQLRFTVTSPANTGLLLDDLRLAPATAQQIVSVEAVPFTLPALVGASSSPLLKLKIKASGSLNPISLTQLQAALHFSDGDLESAQVGFSGSTSQFKTAKSFGKPIDLKSATGSAVTITGKQTLADGDNYIWITGRLRSNANTDRTVGAECFSVKFSNDKFVTIDHKSIQRIGVALRKAGDEGINTFRIPGLATTNQGSLIGVYDVRRRAGGDLPGDVDVGMSRSTDGGQTWDPMKVIMDMGNDPNWRYDGIGDPAVLVDQSTGTIWVAATWSHGDRSWRGSGPGLTAEETGQLMLVRSDDDGVTWSQPINITKQVKKPEWCFILQGPGKGITMQDGTIVFAAQYQDPPHTTDKVAHRLPHSTIIYSKDHGKTWNVGTAAFDDTTEAQVIEVEPGVLMLNCRYNRKSVRVIMTTRDMGETWQKHTTSERSLIEPGSCMASLIDVDQEVGKTAGQWLLFSNPDSTRGRSHITIKASSDQGLTWPKQHRLLLDEQKSAGYSCMTMIDEKTIGILYEGSQAHMTFQRIPLTDVTGNPQTADKPQPKASPQKTSQQSLTLPLVFSSHMVLQSEAELPIWGQAKRGAKVTVTLTGASATAASTLTSSRTAVSQTTVADNSGNWSVRLPSQQTNARPSTLVIQSANEQIEFTNVLIGEVWICAGQSNMEWPLALSASGDEELSKANHPQLRLLHLEGGARGSSGSYNVKSLARLTPKTYADGEWKIASKESAHNFSAVAWYFGRHLQEELKVPVGLICPAVGGTPAEAWIPQEALESDPDLHGLVAGNWLDNTRLAEFCRTRGRLNLLAAIQAGETIPSDEFGPNHSFKPGFMWDAGIKPLIPYAIRGAIWYQGESNAETRDRVREHGHLFPALVNQWRKQWGQGDFPFLYVQLPALRRPEWPWFRDGQRRILNQLKNVGMAVTIDTGHPSNVHPTSKKPVGQRLAKWALGTTYQSKSHAVYSGPLFDRVERKEHSITVLFKHVGDGLRSSNEKPLQNFEVCGKDGFFHPAKAAIMGQNSIAVSSPNVSNPKHVRYAWLAYPDRSPNLINSVDLPASPFTTESEGLRFAEPSPALADQTNQRPNILFIVSEDNSEHLGCYGEQQVHTPHLDALAAGGVRYTRAYVPYSVCSPSRAAFLTGLYTRQTGHIGLATHRFSMYRDFKTMPAYFKQAGYYTGFLGKTHINPERLVEDHIDHRAIKNSNFAKTISIKKYAEEAATVMQKASQQNKPFLLIINYADAHRSFVRKSKNGFPTQLVGAPIPPFPWIGSDSPHLREELRDYFNCMNRLDEGVGMVLAKLKEAAARDNTLIVYISDHGADFPRGKGSIYENGTRIPMIVNDPKRFPKGTVSDSLISTVDILPTMLRAADLPVPQHLPGLALQDIHSGEISPRKYIQTFTTGSSPNLLYVQFGIRDDRYKLVYSPDRTLNLLAASRYSNSKLPEEQHVQSFLHPPEYELFDLQEDPHEWNNLADSTDHQDIRQRLSTAMHDFQIKIKDPFASKQNISTFITEQKSYRHKPYKKAGFRWPHLNMFEAAQNANIKPASQPNTQGRP